MGNAAKGGSKKSAKARASIKYAGRLLYRIKVEREVHAKSVKCKLLKEK